ncbi:MAG: hypothetical protein IPL28_22945, partial [Chloroflexi bacterium]|nr:hypothetical protein [Chloroflexota bacterium]
HAKTAEVRLYENLFSVENPSDVPEGGDFTDHINPASLTTAEALIEPGLEGAAELHLPVHAHRLFLRRPRFHGRAHGLPTAPSPCAIAGSHSSGGCRLQVTQVGRHDL